ncbi:DUF2384 domain-containing protein [Aeromonas australiensis]|nr:DUF2384 domain-containing protein [Aeromonas australiensis]
MFCLATNQIAQTGLSSLPPVIYYSEQLFRVYSVIQALDATISLHNDDLAMAMAWLHCPAKGLGGEIPMNILTTPSGVQAVVDLIGRIEHGVIA